MPQNVTGFKTFTAAAVIEATRVVEADASGNAVHLVTAGNLGVGVAQNDAVTSGQVTVKLWSSPGTFEIIVTGTAVTPGASYHIGAGGYVTITTGTTYVTALESGVASNGIILEFALLP